MVSKSWLLTKLKNSLSVSLYIVRNNFCEQITLRFLANNLEGVQKGTFDPIHLLPGEHGFSTFSSIKYDNGIIFESCSLAGGTIH